MKLVMTLLVRDEEDIVDENIRFHLDHGVDFVIATDNRSVDATPDILRAYERDGVLRTIVETDDDYAQHRWVTRMARMAATEYDADWVINNDADEFWWPLAGDLKTTLATVPRRFGAVRVDRTNFVPVPDDGRPFFERMVVREVCSTNSLGEALPPKVCHRASRTVTVEQGNHDAHGLRWRRTLDGRGRLTILHFPVRTFTQFERKIALGGAAVERNPDLHPTTNHAWRELNRRHHQGELERYYRSLECSPERVGEGIRDGRLVEDLRLRDRLAGRP